MDKSRHFRHSEGILYHHRETEQMDENLAGLRCRHLFSTALLLSFSILQV